MFTAKVLLVCFVLRGAICLPCLSNESKEDFDNARTSLFTLTDHLKSTISKLEKQNATVKTLLNNVDDEFQKQQTIVKKQLNIVGSKVKKLEKDFQVLGKDFKKTKWHKYNGHCYYYSSETTDWFSSERKCREIGGYIVKLDDANEAKQIFSNRPNSGHQYWLGLTDLKEGEFRWSFDQTRESSIPWHPGYGKTNTNYNCVALNTNARWFDYTCTYTSHHFICESNFYALETVQVV